MPSWLLIVPILVATGGELGQAVPAADPAAVVERLLQQPAADFSRRVTAELAPAELAGVFFSHRHLVPPAVQRLGLSLSAPPAGLPPARLRSYLESCARALSREVARHGPPWTDADLALLQVVLLLDPLRFVEQPTFRARVLELVPQAFDRGVPPELRDLLLYELNQVRGVGFEASEHIELGWGAALRASAERSLPYAAGRGRLPRRPQGPIAASVYSLPSQWFAPDAAHAFLAALEQLAPRRRLLVLTDLPLRPQLARRDRGANTWLIETHGRPYTPWPRDSLLLTRGRDGQVVVLQRPNRQAGREEDANFGRELIQGLPTAIDEAWHQAHWSTAPVPFHNGQVLLTEGWTWISIHSLEWRILELLGSQQVPVASFQTAGGIDRYLAAARTAAAELETLYGRPVRFVHPLPESGPLAARSALMRRLGAGAGFDLDSLLTLVPAAGGRLYALVADPGGGGELLGRMPAEDWRRLRLGYGFASGPEELRRGLGEHQRGARVQALTDFLQLVAAHLQGAGLSVHRLPLVLVPSAMLSARDDLDDPDFLITWSNVVIEATAEGIRAEGFSSLLAAGDDEARRVFSQAGCRLELLPPLIPSILRNGGYRCASNHLRAGD